MYMVTQNCNPTLGGSIFVDDNFKILCGLNFTDNIFGFKFALNFVEKQWEN